MIAKYIRQISRDVSMSYAQIMNNAMSTTPKTFIKYLTEQVIEIPILQRDYAQGRKGKEALRKTFLTSLKKAMDDALAKGDDAEPLKLDFVYGSTEARTDHKDADIVLQPLDGQQRLTTLWLWHWYIALRGGKLDHAAKVLSRFSYETRLSSREFCQKMCVPGHFNEYYSLTKPIPIADYITSRTWFYTKWKQDPTIQAMLRMLSGLKDEEIQKDKKRKNKNDIEILYDNDAIEKIFEGTTEDKFLSYWDILTSERAPIQFYHLPLRKFGLSDDLYVKMNARGKALTPFENFKAELIGYIRQQKDREEESAPDTCQDPSHESWAKLTDPRKGIAILLDTQWTDLFWKRRSKENTIDEIYFAFFNRYFWNEVMMSKDTVEDNQSYIYLNKDDSTAFDDFEPYLYDGGEIPVSFFYDLTTVLEHFMALNAPLTVPNQGTFNYVPVYIDKKKDQKEIQVADTITQPGRILFFAITKYLKEGEYDEISLKRWIRVVGNLISGVDENGSQQIRNVEQMRTAIDRIKSLDSHNVYQSLSAQEGSNDTTKAFESRFNEEIEKARQILDDTGKGLRPYTDTSKFKTWEEALSHYESFSFFKGSVRFLFHNEAGEVCWEDFPTKANNAERYFSKTDGYYLNKSATDNQQDNPYLLRVLYSYADPSAFWNAVWWHYHVFSNNDSSWLHLLNHATMRTAVHNLLMGKGPKVYTRPNSDDFAVKTLYLLSQTRLLDYVAQKIPNPWIRDYHGHKAIYPSATGIFLNADFRDNFLQNTPGVTLTGNCMVEDTGLLYGSNIDFAYNNHFFRWCSNDIIYLTTGTGADYAIREQYAKNNAEKYYLFNASGIRDTAAIIVALDDMVCQSTARSC